MNDDAARGHALINRLQTLLLIGLMFGVGGLAGQILFGEAGLWVALCAILAALVVEPVAVSRLTLSHYHARPLRVAEAPQLWTMLEVLARRAGLPAVPVPHYVPSNVINAFAVGNRQNSAIALTDGLLARLSAPELFGVLAHETAHIAHGDLRVMNLADYVSRLTGLFALIGLLILLISLPTLLLNELDIEWTGLLLLAVSPQFALLAQMGLSRVREFDADLSAARLTGDPAALASALAKIERAAHSWRGWLAPGWGNPQPSWLRTHPPTEERIRRLLALAPPKMPDDWRADEFRERRAAVNGAPQLIRHGRYLRPTLGIEADEGINQRLSGLLGGGASPA